MRMGWRSRGIKETPPAATEGGNASPAGAGEKGYNTMISRFEVYIEIFYCMFFGALLGGFPFILEVLL